VDREQAAGIVETALERVRALRSAMPNAPEHVAFVQTVGLQLARIFGRDSAVSRNFSAIKYQVTGGFVANPLNYESELARHTMGAYQRGLGIAEGILLSASELLALPDVSGILRAGRIRSEGARIFISHGKTSPALEKVERLLRALGLQPVIVARGPSEGMAVDDLVEARMDECDCAIILATADDKIDSHYQPRPNVIHEIGMAQQKLADKVIYLKEEGCEFPSNVRPKVWETFTQSNLETAYEKISKELRAFGLL
jgi:hypothetical protein